MESGDLVRSKPFLGILGVLAVLAMYVNFNPEQREGLVIRGRVTLDGKELPDGTISFVPVNASGGKVSGAKIEAGKYASDHKRGIQPGKYRVEIYSYEGTGNSPIDLPTPRVPAGWNRNSEHVITVTQDQLEHDFSVTTK